MTDLTLLYDAAVMPVEVFARGAQVDAVIHVVLVHPVQQVLHLPFLFVVERLKRSTRAKSAKINGQVFPVSVYQRTNNKEFIPDISPYAST